MSLTVEVEANYMRGGAKFCIPNSKHELHIHACMRKAQDCPLCMTRANKRLFIHLFCSLLLETVPQIGLCKSCKVLQTLILIHFSLLHPVLDFASNFWCQKWTQRF